jgi:predicted type IV restriction endonuclease
MPSDGWISDDAYAAYTKWLEDVHADPALNEDTTRVRLIDAILFDVLKWDRNFVETEPHVKNKGYADYIFHTKGGRTLVLEAKASGSAFVLPDHEGYPDRAVSFKYISEQCPDAHKAMQQAVTYANSVGARYTVISNGHQWILMLTSVEGALLDDRNVIVFQSLHAIKIRFKLFWDCFSPLMIQVNKPYALLVDIRRQPAPAKLSSTIAQYPVRREDSDIRNQHATSIQYIWDEVNNNEGTETFFEECYVPPVGHEKNRGLNRSARISNI